MQKRACDTKALLLAWRQHLVPVRFLREPLRQRGKSHSVERIGYLADGNGPVLMEG